MKIKFTHLSYAEILKLFMQSVSDFPKLSDENFAMIFAEKLSNNAEFIVCEDKEKEIKGFIAFYMNQPPFVYLSHVYISKDTRGKGYFHKMLDRIKEEAKLRTSFNYIRLEISDNNSNAYEVYQRLGFVVYETNEKRSSQYMQMKIKNDGRDCK